MNVSLVAYGLAPSILAALFRAGFRYQKDLENISARDLACEAKIDVKDAVEVLEIVRSEDKVEAVGVTALDLLQKLSQSKPISMGLQMDRLLGGGLQRGEVTEICGSPGSGKTQFGIHACLAAQYVVNASGNPSSAIFIDSEGSFIVERVASMAEHFIADFSQICSNKLSRDDLLRGISYYRVHDFVEQMECNLLVIDTIAFHFRHGFENYVQRARALDEVAVFLHNLATDFNIAIVLINHITTKSTAIDRQSSQEQPALGDGWAHSITSRIVFGWETNCRIASLIKSATLAHHSIAFQVSERGLRDVIEDK
ncbi:dna repair protein rad51 [Plasmopara halstedii]|uniref:DNA repair protein RAD51 homolog 3 n=1 Tax=Plasmopara halstedii TaxID=4781 RepID=A0A0P1A5U0_PLAHL|nr:dna repair protein rad51 [Plasmopara halstedii]CEG35728.1 dna repair protein rad51 [Plasmopara halstedii]|eukprot:XP_024572097.1 dna repair protein rad51 [Plasmopara halstedii]